MKNTLAKWAPGQWDDEVWSFVIHVMGIACLLTVIGENIS